MFQLHIRQYVFKLSTGETKRLLVDAKQCLCISSLSSTDTWSIQTVLARDASRFFCAELDREDVIHLLFQDTRGNIRYLRLTDGQIGTAKLENRGLESVPVLMSRNPEDSDKHLQIALAANTPHFFYVIQHEASFLLAYQVLIRGNMSSPRVVDYVSGSSQPCTVVYDNAGALYVFYQSFDGKHLQLGYKKQSAGGSGWSEFSPVTKYAGTCEYPHVFIDGAGTIHLAYQRRSPKVHELVYQQKTADKNTWAQEMILHSSIHSFENLSILQSHDRLIIYWVREEVIYYSAGTLTGTGWAKPSRLSFKGGRSLLCIGYKSNSPRDMLDFCTLRPILVPGTLSEGLQLAFITDPYGEGNAPSASNTAGSHRPNAPGASPSGGIPSGAPTQGTTPQAPIPARPDTPGAITTEGLRQLRGILEEVRNGRDSARNELSKLAQVTGNLRRDIEKLTIRLDLLEGRISPAATTPTSLQPNLNLPASQTATLSAPDNAKSPATSLSQEERKKWEEWEEPKEWQGIGDDDD